MRTSLVQMLVPLAMVAAACGGGATRSAQLSDDLKQDLAASSAPKLELASAAGDFKPMRFVSDIEQTNASTPVSRAPSPRPVRKPAPEPQPQIEAPSETPPMVQEETQVAVTPQPEEAVSAVPTVAPRPAALPVDVPSSGAIGDRDDRRIGGPSDRGDRGGNIGGIIGVVIRGGGVGDDHCVPRRRGGGRSPFPIPPFR
jgi:hypothetical protein